MDDRDEYEQLLKDAVRIEPLALEEEFVRLPADLAYFNEQHAQCYEKHLNIKLNREQIEATLRGKAVDALEAENEGTKRRLTEGAIDSWVVTHPRFVEVRREEITAETDERRLRGVVTAILAKKDMLVSIGAHHRAEMSDPMVRVRAQEARALNNENDFPADEE